MNKKRTALLAIVLCAFASIVYAYGSCRLIGEKRRGIYKTCFYDCYGREKQISIDFTAFCPYSIND